MGGKMSPEYHKAYYKKYRPRMLQQNKERYLKNKERYFAANRLWAKNNPEKYKAIQDRWRAKNREYIKLRWVCWKYKVTQEQALALRSKKTCEVCGRETKLHVDHDHKTGVVRGMLCGSCNRALGLLQESEQSLLNMVAYLKKERDGK